jgi:hypothetical protein
VTPPKPAPATQTASIAKPTAVDPAARFTQVEAERVMFMDNLRSYDSVDMIREQLQKSGFSAQASTIEKKVSRSRYPPFRSDTLQVEKFKHAGHEGKLTLEFFNDRLYEAQFVPDKPDAYLKTLRSKGVPLKYQSTGRTSFTRGPLQVSSNIDFAASEVGRSMHARPFVLWNDQRLTQQMRDWGPLP